MEGVVAVRVSQSNLRLNSNLYIKVTVNAFRKSIKIPLATNYETVAPPLKSLAEIPEIIFEVLAISKIRQHP